MDNIPIFFKKFLKKYLTTGISIIDNEDSGVLSCAGYSARGIGKECEKMVIKEVNAGQDINIKLDAQKDGVYIRVDTPVSSGWARINPREAKELKEVLRIVYK